MPSSESGGGIEPSEFDPFPEPKHPLLEVYQIDPTDERACVVTHEQAPSPHRRR